MEAAVVEVDVIAGVDAVDTRSMLVANVVMCNEDVEPLGLLPRHVQNSPSTSLPSFVSVSTLIWIEETEVENQEAKMSSRSQSAPKSV